MGNENVSECGFLYYNTKSPENSPNNFLKRQKTTTYLKPKE